MMFGNKRNESEPVLLYPQTQGSVFMYGPVFVEFHGAVCDVDDFGNLIDFQPRGPIVINANSILGYYDHTILIKDKKIRVMETCREISLKILEARKYVKC